MIPLHSALSVGFLVLFFLFCFFIHVPPPHYWCRLAVSGSNNIAEWFSKNTGAAARLFRGVTLGGGRQQSAAPLNRRGFARTQTGPLTDTSCGAGVSSLLGRRGGTLSHETERMSVCLCAGEKPLRPSLLIHNQQMHFDSTTDADNQYLCYRII